MSAGAVDLGLAVASAGDFSGDGRDDVIAGGFKLVGSGTFSIGNAVVYLSSSLDASTTIPNDFNGDRNSDLLIYNTVTGDVLAGLYDGSNVFSNDLIITEDPATGWTVNATGDFNSDGNQDIFYANTITNEIGTILLDGSTVLSNNPITTIDPASGLVAQGTGDFNGDDRDEIILHNPATGLTLFLFLNATGTAALPPLQPVTEIDVANGWTLHDTGDFDGDGKDDLLLYNTVSGGIMIAFVNDSTILSFSGVMALDPTSDFVVADTADFNADGKTDLLIQNTTTGLTVIFTLDGSTIDSTIPVFEMNVAGGETLVNAGDYNADGFSDLLFHNTVTGDVTVLFLDNGAVQNLQGVINLDFSAGLTLHSGKP